MEVGMSDTRTFRWQVLVSILLGVGMVGTIVAVFLLMPAGQEARGDSPAAHATAGYQTTENLTLTVTLAAVAGAPRRAPLEVQLIDPDGLVLESVRPEVEPTGEVSAHRFEFRLPKLAADKITVRVRFGEQKPIEVSLNSILLVKAHETALSAGQEFFAGSQASLRCEVHGVKSISQTVPLPGATVEVRLRDPAGKELAAYKGKTDDKGVAAVAFPVPALPPGSYKMEVLTKSALGEEKLQRDVKIKTAPKVLLVTDKPLYQPGQRMHLRALALQTFDLLPLADRDLTFEVEDAKGNKVFKRSLKTSAYGVASADFDLADEVNAGDYRVRAILGEHTADKTVGVRPYVLPKFKTQLTADKKYYLPKETIHADLQTDYFFGKPVAKGKVKVTASTFDVAFKDFQTWEGTTDEQGHVKFEIKLPDYFVGQPLQKGNALVRLEVKVTDTADHSEVINKTYPVSAQPIQLTLIPEGGRLLPGLENRIFAAAVYPDGSPATCTVKIWSGNKAEGKPLAEVKTSEAGLAEFRVTPKPDQFRQGGWGQRTMEMLGGRQQMIGGPLHFFDLTAEARDAKGETARTTAALYSEPMGENILLRLDKAIYKGGDRLNVDIRTSAGLPTVYLDIVKGGQTVLTKWLDVKDGRAEDKMDLPEAVFGTLEVHAYQMLSHGEIIRDSRVVYVNPAAELKIDVRADKDVYAPGANGTIRFQVTDGAGKPAAAALGVLIVDEAVYALQEMQPGLEKVYFTLQEELLKPQAQAIYKPAESLQDLVREPVLPDARQQTAEVLLTAIRPKPPARWEVDPVLDRRQKLEQQVLQIGWGIYQYAQSNPTIQQQKDTGKWDFRPGLLQDLVKSGNIQAAWLTDPVGGTFTLESLAAVEKDFTPENLAKAITQGRMQQLVWAVANLAEQNKGAWLKGGKWTIPETAVADAAKTQNWPAVMAQDAWGRPLRLLPRAKKGPNPWGHAVYNDCELMSAGPDGKLGTDDDVTLSAGNAWPQVWWITNEALRQQQGQMAWAQGGRQRLRLGDGAILDGAINQFGAPGGGFMGGGGPRRLAAGAGGLPPPAAPMAAARPMMQKDAKGAKDAPAKPSEAKGEARGGGAEPPRLREYFPETLLWQPALITDDRGTAELAVPFADSITTWRLTASASSKGGLLGGVDRPLRVFQDFFVDIDLPVALTQNDEVAFPVAVYNYLKEPQTVKIDLHQEAWFDLLDSQGLSRSLDLKPNEVTSVKYRIRAKKVGHFPLTVDARGTKTSDAVKRSIEVIPDGKKFEQVFTDRLGGKVSQWVTIPDNAIPDASRLFVKVYPGVMSQVLEGAEGLLRLPGG
jgi:hypothetical protein